MNKQTTKRILVKLEVENAVQLYLMLGSDGAITRLGPIDVTRAVRGDMCVGKTEEPVFDNFMALVPDDMYLLLGNSIELPPDNGGHFCRLTILVSDGNEEKGVQWVYGSESQGPPVAYTKLIQEGVQLTQSWYDNYLQAVAK